MKKELGLRKETPESTDISRANSIRGNGEENLRKSNELERADRQEEDDGVRALGPNGEELIIYGDTKHGDEIEGRADTTAGKNYEKTMGKLARVISKMRGNDKRDSTKE
jgi:hypothetical protein